MHLASSYISDFCSMKNKMRTKLLLAVSSALFVMVPAQDIVLSFTRILGFPNPNTIILACTEAATDSLVANVRNGEAFELPRRQDTQGGALFTVTQDTEGIYECAREGNTNSAQRSNEVIIVALPTDVDDLPSNLACFQANEGDTAHIDCPVTPGSLLSHYYVSWTNGEEGEDQIVFYANSVSDSQVTRASDRYCIDPTTFSLLISDVTPGDMRFEYHCLLGVEQNLANPSGEDVYTFAANIPLKLLVSKIPQFTVRPLSQTVVAGVSVNFTCKVLSSPTGIFIQWQHGLSNASFASRYSIDHLESPNSNLEEGGVVTTSTLTIPDVTGFDSNHVMCQAVASEFPADLIQEDVSLTVLDTVEFNVIPLQDAGFILRVTLKRLVLEPIQLRVIFTDTTDSSRTQPLTTLTQYSNVAVIDHRVSLDDIPQFADTFTLAVAMVQGPITGPFTTQNIAYRRQLLDPCKKDLGILGGILGGIMAIIVIFFAILLIVLVVALARQPRDVRCFITDGGKLFLKILKDSLCRRNYNGLSEDRSKDYVRYLSSLVDLAKTDPAIAPHWNPNPQLHGDSNDGEYDNTV